MERVTKTQYDAFLNEARIACIITLGADGAPTMVPIWYKGL